MSFVTLVQIFVKTEKNIADADDTFLTESLCYKLVTWGLTDEGIYQAGLKRCRWLHYRKCRIHFWTLGTKLGYLDLCCFSVDHSSFNLSLLSHPAPWKCNTKSQSDANSQK